jgi:hypothetical protein
MDVASGARMTRCLYTPCSCLCTGIVMLHEAILLLLPVVSSCFVLVQLHAG